MIKYVPFFILLCFMIYPNQKGRSNLKNDNKEEIKNFINNDIIFLQNRKDSLLEYRLLQDSVLKEQVEIIKRLYIK